MWHYVILLALIGPVFCSVLEYTEFDDPYGTLDAISRKVPPAQARDYYAWWYTGKCNGTTAGVTQYGMCQSSGTCTLASGTSAGQGGCNSIYQCCIYSGTCGTNSDKMVSYFNYDGSTASATSCSYTVTANKPSICYVRLEFELFESANPTQAGTGTGFQCQSDMFSVTTPNGFKVPIICGYNTGQHMFIPMNASNSENSVTLAFTLAARSALTTALGTPKWRIRVEQLDCPSRKKYWGFNQRSDSWIIPPPGCLQYWTAQTGTIMNFGYNPGLPVTSNNYIINMDYSICFKRLPNTCGMKITALAFQMSGTANDCGVSAVMDYLFMPEATTVTTAGTATNTNSRLCATMITTTTFARNKGYYPEYLHFFTDTLAAAPTSERGWMLNFQMLATGSCV